MWEAWQELGRSAQYPIIAAAARLVVQGLRKLGVECRPGLESILIAVAFGAISGYATRGWEGAIIGALSGFAGTGLWEAQRQGAAYLPELRALKEAEGRMRP